jgi:hypothetical protein
MSKQTAVQWLIEQMINQGYFDCNKPLTFTNLDHLQHQAMQIEREQIISNYCSGFKASAEGWNGEYGLKDMLNISEEIKAEQYYNQTYGGQDEK